MSKILKHIQFNGYNHGELLAFCGMENVTEMKKFYSDGDEIMVCTGFNKKPTVLEPGDYVFSLSDGTFAIYSGNLPTANLDFYTKSIENEEKKEGNDGNFALILKELRAISGHLKSEIGVLNKIEAAIRKGFDKVK